MYVKLLFKISIKLLVYRGLLTAFARKANTFFVPRDPKSDPNTDAATDILSQTFIQAAKRGAQAYRHWIACLQFRSITIFMSAGPLPLLS